MNLDRGGVFLDIGLENDDDVIARDEATEEYKKTTAILRGIAVVIKI